MWKRRGFYAPIEGGTYEVKSSHAQRFKRQLCRPSCFKFRRDLAFEIASGLNIPAYIVDPVVVDELSDIARISGNSPFMERKSIFHAAESKIGCLEKVAKEMNSHI